MLVKLIIIDTILEPVYVVSTFLNFFYLEQLSFAPIKGNFFLMEEPKPSCLGMRERPPPLCVQLPACFYFWFYDLHERKGKKQKKKCEFVKGKRSTFFPFEVDGSENILSLHLPYIQLLPPGDSNSKSVTCQPEYTELKYSPNSDCLNENRKA